MAAENNNGAYSISHADESHAQERALSPQITVPPHALNLQWAGLPRSFLLQLHSNATHQSRIL
jgi:hypothetical protein